MAVDARFRREWRKKNPILRMNEIGIDLNDNSQKLGDGRTRWNDLSYMNKPKPAVTLGEGGVPADLVDAVAALNETIVTKQDVTTATTDSELAAAVANLNSLLSGKQDSGTAATDTELTAAVNSLNAALANKQDANTAATDAELLAALSDRAVYVNAGANANTPRPPNAVLVVWGCDLGVTPVNAAWPDIINNKSA